MKKTYISVVLSLLAISCARNEEMDSTKVDAPEEKAIEIQARIVDSQGTRTNMGTLSGDIYPVYWSQGDKISLISGGHSTSVTITSTPGSPEGTFGGSAADLVNPFPGTVLYPAAYPANKAFAQVSGDKIKVGSYLPHKQKYKSGTFDDNVYPMAAVTSEQGSEYDFYNLCGIIQLKLKANDEGDPKNTIRALYLTGNDHEALAGGVGMYFNIADGSPVETSDATCGPDGRKYEIGTYGSEAYERVIIDFGETPLQLKPSEITYINIAVIPQTFAHGITVELVDGGTMGSSYLESQDNLVVKRSCVKSMKTVVYPQPDPVDIANSYIYSEPGYYIMPAYAMGNRLDLGLITDHGSDELEADLLWTDLVDAGGQPLPAVTNIEYLPFQDGKGMVQFKLNVDPATEKAYRGNAAIALYEKDTRKILWSWHIWMCEETHDIITGGTVASGSYSCQYPDGSTYNYSAEASSGKLIILDRNIGAISANPADGWKTYGLYYQNGRRDPFIGSCWNGTNVAGVLTTYTNDNYKVRDDESVAFGGEHTRTTWVNTSLAPMEWTYFNGHQDVTTALAHPLTYSTSAPANNQWTDYTTADNKSWLDPSVGGAGSTHGTTGLLEAGHEAYWNRTKTIMDPCPVGYSVLGERNGVFVNNDTKTYRVDEAAGIFGVNTSFTYQGTTYDCWWPFAGVRTVTGKLGSVGYMGLYFFYDHIEATHGGHGMVLTNGSWTSGKTTNHAGSIRCVREKQFDGSGNPTVPLK